MPSERKFYRRVIQIEVLAEACEDIPNELADVAEFITTGDGSGWVETVSDEEIDAPTAARLLIAQGSDPSFFRLTQDGEDDTSEP